MSSIADGNIRVAWVTTISNTSAPTTTELNAGVDLTPYITPDGWSVTTDTAAVDSTALNSVDDLRLPGRRSDQIEVTMNWESDTTAPYSTFASRPAGYLVERVGVAHGTAWTASQKVRVFTVKMGDRQRVPVAANELIKFSVEAFKTAATVDPGTVA